MTLQLPEQGRAHALFTEEAQHDRQELLDHGGANATERASATLRAPRRLLCTKIWLQ